MARRLLRVASVAVVGGALVGVIVGAGYMANAIQQILNGADMAGLLAGWAIVVIAISGVLAGFATWSWQAPFKPATIGLTVAGAVIGYWAIIYRGHDQTMFVACGVVSVIVLGFTATALVVSEICAGGSQRDR